MKLFSRLWIAGYVCKMFEKLCADNSSLLQFTMIGVMDTHFINVSRSFFVSVLFFTTSLYI